MKRNYRRISIAVLCILSFVLAPFGAIKAEAKSEREKVVELANKVRPYDLLWKDRDEIEVAVVLANTKPKVAREALSPEPTVYNEYRLSDFEKTSKALFGKVIETNFESKKNEKYAKIYYNSKTKTIYAPLSYDPGDWIAFTKHREVKATKDGFEVINYDVNYHWMEIDRRPNQLTKIRIKPSGSSKYGYIITGIERADFSSSKLNLSKKAVDNQLKLIKKWYAKPTAADRKEGYEKDGMKYSTLYHDDNLVFVMKNDGHSVFRYYYKYGVLIHAIESTVKGNKTLKKYEAEFKNGFYYINRNNMFDAPEYIEDLMELIEEADYAFEVGVSR